MSTVQPAAENGPDVPENSHHNQAADSEGLNRDAASVATAAQLSESASPAPSPLAGPAELSTAKDGKNAAESLFSRFTKAKSQFYLARRLVSGSRAPRSSSQPAPSTPLDNDATRTRTSRSVDVSMTPLPDERHQPTLSTSLSLHNGSEVDPMAVDAPVEATDAHSPNGDDVNVSNENVGFDGQADNGVSPHGDDTNAPTEKVGLDGQENSRVSPALSSSTTHSAMARTSRASARTRKPTVRAIEAQESEAKQRLRKAKQNGKKAAGRDAPQGDDMHSDFILSEQLPDFEEMSKHVFDAAQEIFSPKFRQSVNGASALDELRKEFQAGGKSAPATPTKKTPTKGKQARGKPTRGKGKAPEGGVNKAVRRKLPARRISFSLDKYTQTGERRVDDNGWTHTGRTNEQGEEVIFTPEKYTWYRPRGSYEDDALPEPPVRAKAQDQVVDDRVLGFPPLLGERNLPFQSGIRFVKEDVEAEKVKVKIRGEARRRRITVTPYMSVHELGNLITEHDLKFGAPAERP